MPFASGKLAFQLGINLTEIHSDRIDSVAGNATIDRNAFAVGTGPNAADLGANVTLNFAFDAIAED